MLKRYALAILLSVAASSAQAQCALGSAYYWQTHSPATPNVPVVSTGTWKQNIIYINVNAGSTYMTGNCTAVNGTNSATGTGTSITVRYASAGAVIAYQSGTGGQCATFTAPVTGQVWAYVYKDDCNTEGSGFTYGSMLVGCTPPANIAVTGITYEAATINWTTGGGTTPIGYEYDITTSATPPASGTYVTSTTANASALNSSTTYYFHVRAKCGPTEYSMWSTKQFTTAVNPCNFPIGLSASNVTVSSMDLSWAPVAGSTGYEYIFDQNPGMPATAGTPTTATSFSRTGLMGGTTYYLHLRNRCSPTSISNWTIAPFSTLPCNAPVNILTSNITDTSADLIWSAMTNANNYEYQIDQSYDPPLSGSGLTTTASMSTHITGLQANNKYYIHIRTLCFTSDVSSWALDSFITRTFCPAPAITVNNPNTNSPDAYWPAIPEAIMYEYAVNSNVAPPAFGAEISVPQTPILSLPGDGKDYYLHVRSKCNSMFSFSAWATAPLRVAATNVALQQEQGFDVIAYPNPASDKLYIIVKGGVTGTATCVITDMQGRVLHNIAVTAATTETNIAHLPAGIYLLKYTSEGQTEVLKLHKK